MKLLNDYPIGTQLTCRDASLGILFPDYYLPYRLSGCSIRNSSKFRIAAKNEDNTYQITLMSCAPEQGRVLIPNTSATVTLHQLHLAIAYSTVELPKEPFENPHPRQVNVAEHRNKCGRAKLNEDKVREIRELHEQGFTNRQIGERYGVSAPAIYLIVTKQTWTDVE